MLSSALLVAVTGLVSVSAQNLNYSTSGNISIVPSSVPLDERQNWCTAQRNSCPEICGTGGAYPNTCDAQTLDYNCNCTSGISPNISNYDQTVPSYVCMQWKIDCVANNANNQNAQAGCLSLVCGQLNASNGLPIADATGSVQPASTATLTSSDASTETDSSETSAYVVASATTTDGSMSSTASPTTGSSSSSTASPAAAVAYVANNYGTSIFATVLIALFGFAL